MLAVITALLMIILVVIDQMIKLIAQYFLTASEEPVTVISGFLQLRYVENTGAAFGFFSEHTGALTAVTTIVIAVITVLFFVGIFTKRVRPSVMYVSLLFLLSGGIGNLVDRIWRGYVIDYIEPTFVQFAVFNFADCLVTVGAFLLVCWLIYDIIVETKREYRRKRENTGEDGHA